MSDHGRFVWYDLVTPDPEASIAFYGDVVGWGTQPFENEGGPPYTMWTRGETPVGGMVPLGEAEKEKGIPPHWTAYVSVADAEATAAKATELGGAIVHPVTEIPNVGRFVVIRDPHNAVVSVYTSASPGPDPEPEPPIGAFSWHELMTEDSEAAVDFYGKLFGWEVLDVMDMGDGMKYRMYGRPGEPPLGGIGDKPPEMEGPPCWIYYVRIEGLDAAIERLSSGGGNVVMGPMEVPGGDRIIQAFDPHGAIFALHETAAG